MDRFEVQHRLGHPLDSTVVLLDDVVEVLDLAHDDRNVAVSIDRIDGRLVGAALVHRDFFGLAVRREGVVFLFQEKGWHCSVRV